MAKEQNNRQRYIPVTRAWTSSMSFCFSSASKLLYHFARRVLPARFWIRMNLIGILGSWRSCRTRSEGKWGRRRSSSRARRRRWLRSESDDGLDVMNLWWTWQVFNLTPLLLSCCGGSTKCSATILAGQPRLQPFLLTRTECFKPLVLFLQD